MCNTPVVVVALSQLHTAAADDDDDDGLSW